MSTQETQGAPAWPAAAGPRTLASDADRDTTASLLNAALAEGSVTVGIRCLRLRPASRRPGRGALGVLGTQRSSFPDAAAPGRGPAPAAISGRSLYQND